jgi:glutamate 5-kinase
MERAELLKDVNRVVVKIGTSTLTYANGRINLSRIEKLVRQISDIHNSGVDVVVVSSGAIGAGMGMLNLKERPSTLPQKQAIAAVGQGALLYTWQKLFSEYGKTIGQVLLTNDDIANRVRFLNARNTFFALMDMGIIPIVNENDAVATDEIKVGDNDTLSALVSSVIEADLLILLTDIDGLYDKDPNENEDAKLIKTVSRINKKIQNAASGAGSKFGTGGMATKISAGKIAVASGTNMIIAPGHKEKILNKIIDREDVGTLFLKKEKVNAKKHWIAYGSKQKGEVVIDEGAEKALRTHKSLLPSGIKTYSGKFTKGSTLNIKNEKGESIGKGVTNYGSETLKQIVGVKTSEIEKILGHKDYDEIIHADNMLVTKYYDDKEKLDDKSK